MWSEEGCDSLVTLIGVLASTWCPSTTPGMAMLLTQWYSPAWEVLTVWRVRVLVRGVVVVLGSPLRVYPGPEVMVVLLGSSHSTLSMAEEIVSARVMVHCRVWSSPAVGVVPLTEETLTCWGGKAIGKTMIHVA